MVKIGQRRYCKLLTVRSKLISLMDDFDGKHDISLSYGNESCHVQLSCALAALECIIQEL